MQSMEKMAEETARRIIEEYVSKIKGDKGDSGKDSTIPGPRGPKGDSVTGPRGPAGPEGKSIPGKDGANGYTPVEDVDYPSVRMMKGMVDEMMKAMEARMMKGGMTKKQMAEMKAMCEKEMDPKKLARAFEALAYKDKLDYEKGLKNKPGIPVEGPQQRTLHRGGPGKQTYNYDLSDLCNGVDKTFAIPTNARVVSVSGTDAPGGIYRPLVDWSGSGTAVLTLTAAVAAPNVGATLYILYVV
jgi:hypothetical protein